MSRQGTETNVITGASRGLGLEFTRQWLAGGDHVWALARDPEGSDGLQRLRTEFGERLRCLPCDVGDDASVAAAAATIAAGEPVDVVLNNAGIYLGRSDAAADVDLDDMRQCFEINTLGPLRVARALMPALGRSTRPRLVNMTSLMGSIADNGSGSSYAYRTSKAALNMVTRCLAHEVAPAGIAVALHPGWVRTAMGGKHAPLAIKEAVASMIGTIDGLDAARTGGFVDREGAPLPW